MEPMLLGMIEDPKLRRGPDTGGAGLISIVPGGGDGASSSAGGGDGMVSSEGGGDGLISVDPDGGGEGAPI